MVVLPEWMLWLPIGLTFFASLILTAVMAVSQRMSLKMLMREKPTDDEKTKARRTLATHWLVSYSGRAMFQFLGIATLGAYVIGVGSVVMWFRGGARQPIVFQMAVILLATASVLTLPLVYSIIARRSVIETAKAYDYAV